MNGWTVTKVWQINQKLVVADTIEEAIALYKKAFDKVPVESVYAVGSSSVIKDYDALIQEK